MIPHRPAALAGLGLALTALLSGPAYSVDAPGDPLPAGSLVRLGTLRFRQGSAILAVTVTPDGRTAASVGRDGTVRLWEIPTGRELRRFAVGSAQTAGLAFAPDGKSLAATGGSGSVRLWDVASGRLLRTFPRGYGAVAFSHDGRSLAAATDGQNVYVWDTATGKEMLRTAKHRREVMAVTFAADGKAVLSAGGYEDRAIRSHELATGKERGKPINHANNIYAIALSPDGRTLAIAGYFPALQLRDAATGDVIHTLDGGKIWCRSVAFTPDGRGVVSGSDDGAVRLWDVPSGKVLRRFAGLCDAVHGVAVSADGKVLVAGGADRVLRAWDVASGKALEPAGGHGHRITALRFSTDGKTLTTAARDATVRTWDTATGKQLRRHDGPTDWTGDGLLSPDGKTVACTCSGDVVRLWDVEGRRLKLMIRERRALAFAPDGKRLATTGGGAAVFVWDIADVNLLHRLVDRSSVPLSAAWSPDGKLLASGHSSRAAATRLGAAPDRVALWDTATGKLLRTFPAYLTLMQGPLVFGPDGRTVAALDGRRGPVSLWEAATGKRRRRFALHPPPRGAEWTSYYEEELVSGLAISPDGRLLALGLEHVVYLWDAWTGEEVGRLAGHEGKVTALAFSPDGKALASAGDDTTVLLWDVTALPSRRLAEEKFTPAALEGLWAELARDTAGDALARLVRAPAQAVALLRGRVRPVPVPQPGQRAQLFDALESPRFKEREAAMRDLEAFTELIEPDLRERLAVKPAEEGRRRLKQLLARQQADSGEQLRLLRSVELLEHIGSPDARAVLQELARGAEQARLTRAAAAALARLGKRPAAPDPPR
jgi:WD40 repeat protein